MRWPIQPGAISIGFQRGTHANWQIVQNSGSGAPTLIDLGASFLVGPATNVLTLFLCAAHNAGFAWVRVVEEVSGAITEVELTAKPPRRHAAAQPAPLHEHRKHRARRHLRLLGGGYVETDY